MNQVTVTEEKKESVTKTMAIVGFIAIILFIVWLAVQIVQVIPSAFSSLASIADGVYGSHQTELVIATEKSVVNVEESVRISWTDLPGNGTYSFSYECANGVSITIGSTVVACDTAFALEDTTSVEIVISSEKERFVDVIYAITYTEASGDKIITTSVLTVTNTSIENSTSTEDEQETEGEVAGESTSTTTTPIAGEPTTIEEIIYEIPVSDPNGFIDLQVTHIGVGILIGNNFIPASTIDVDQKGAIRFEIKNIGTKTASDWSYEVELPSDITYDAGDQDPLKPNERAVVTVGFEGITRTGVERFGADIDADDDINSANDRYTWSVSIVD